jgi:hypothetical protein
MPIVTLESHHGEYLGLKSEVNSDNAKLPQEAETAGSDLAKRGITC